MIEVFAQAARALFSEAGVIALLLFLALLYTLYRESIAIRRAVVLQEKLIDLTEKIHIALDRQLNILTSIKDNQSHVLSVIREKIGGR